MLKSKIIQNLVEDTISDLAAIVSKMKISMVNELNMAAIIDSSDWWLDSGATIHVCNGKAQSKSFEATKNGQEVSMGNHNSAKVYGKGSVEFQFTYEKKLALLNVFHVLELIKNLVSSNFSCKDGIKVILE